MFEPPARKRPDKRRETAGKAGSDTRKAAQDRDARLAEALRDNLRRRKDADRKAKD